MSAKKSDGRMIAENRKAFHEYFIIEEMEAGIELTGTEVKSLRNHNVNLRDSFARIVEGELWLERAHISPYEHGNRFNHDPFRRRRLLMKKHQIARLAGKMREKGFTLVPLRLYWKGNWAKISVALVKGKAMYDKRESIKDREGKRIVERALRESVR